MAAGVCGEAGQPAVTRVGRVSGVDNAPVLILVPLYQGTCARVTHLSMALVTETLVQGLNTYRVYTSRNYSNCLLPRFLLLFIFSAIGGLRSLIVVLPGNCTTGSKSRSTFEVCTIIACVRVSSSVCEKK